MTGDISPGMEAKRFRRQNIAGHLQNRMRILAAIRNFFSENGYLEVETPIRIPAPAPEEYIDCVEAGSWFLQASPELAMKELLASGFGKIYQMARCFREGERGGRHLPEMTLLEWYVEGEDYHFMMAETERLIRRAAGAVGREDRLFWQGRSLDLKGPWERMTVAEAFSRYGRTPLDQALAEGRFDEVIALEVEPRLGAEKPVFLYDYPRTEASLARVSKTNPAVAERFELYLFGVEICNAFSELTDAKEQKIRFADAMAVRRKRGKTVYPEARTFLAALKEMPEACGNALGIDRLVMLLSDAPDINGVTAILPEEL